MTDHFGVISWEAFYIIIQFVGGITSNHHTTLKLTSAIRMHIMNPVLAVFFGVLVRGFFMTGLIHLLEWLAGHAVIVFHFDECAPVFGQFISL